MIHVEQRIFANRQRGVAAIEFSLVFMVLFLFLYGIVTFGSVFYVQQVISRAAEDGARTVSQLPTALSPDDKRFKDIRDSVYDSLAESFIVPLAGSTNPRNWLLIHMHEPLIELKGNSIVITVIYPYNNETRLLPSLFGSDFGLPTELKGQATALGRS